MVKRFGWIYGLIMAGEGLLFSAIGLLARIIFKTMILGNSNVTIEGDIPQHMISDIMMNPSFGFYDEFHLQAWKVASMFTGFIIGLGLVIVVLGLALAIALKIWGNKKEEF